MILHRACLDEFAKIAADQQYRQVVVSGKRVSIPESMLYISRLPRSPEKLKQVILDRLREPSENILGYKNVALKADELLPRLKELGFKQTRIAVPLPGEPVFSPSWRLGRLHIHRSGPLLMAHEDKISPEGVFATISHAVREGVPAVGRRLLNSDSAIVKEGSTQLDKQKQQDSPFKRWLRTQGRILAEDTLYEAAEVAARNFGRSKYPVGQLATHLAR